MFAPEIGKRVFNDIEGFSLGVYKHRTAHILARKVVVGHLSIHHAAPVQPVKRFGCCIYLDGLARLRKVGKIAPPPLPRHIGLRDVAAPKKGSKSGGIFARQPRRGAAYKGKAAKRRRGHQACKRTFEHTHHSGIDACYAHRVVLLGVKPAGRGQQHGGQQICTCFCFHLRMLGVMRIIVFLMRGNCKIPT